MRLRVIVGFAAVCALAAGSLAPRAASPAPLVTHIPAALVDATFARGGPLVRAERYQVHAARRGEPGPAEIHDADTDIFYIVDGSATLVTGGAVAGATSSGPGEMRGTALEGGEALAVSKGDVVVIPHGTPHHISDVKGTLLYLVVKVAR